MRTIKDKKKRAATSPKATKQFSGPYVAEGDQTTQSAP
jgi:hypothetical protein